MSPKIETRQTWLKSAARIAVFGAFYYAAARLGLLFSFEAINVSPIWPAAGVALSGLLLLGPRAWPGIWLGAFAANTIVFFQGAVASPAMILWGSTLIASGNTLEALAGWLLCYRWSSHIEENRCCNPLFAEFNVFRFAALALMVGVVGACIGTAAICAAGIQPWSRFSLLWLIWWFGDASGVMFVTPFLLAWTQPIRIRSDPAFWTEALMAFGLLALTCWAVFMEGLSVYPYLTLPPLVWIAARLGPRAVASGIVFVSTWAIWQTTQGSGPFVNLSEEESLLRLLVFLWVASLTCMALAGTVAVRKKSEAALQKLTDELEERVKERTDELQSSNEALRQSEQRFHSAAHYFPGVFTIYDARKRFIFVNGHAAQLAGRGEQEMLGHADEELFPAETTIQYMPALNRCVDSRAPQNAEATLALPGGTRTYLFSFVPLLDENGEIFQILGIAYDITEREARLTAIVETAPDAIISADSQGLLIGWNNGARRIFGYEAEEVLGKPLATIMPERYREAEARGFQRFSSTGESNVLSATIKEWHGLRKDGTEFPIELSLSTWKLGGATFFTGIIRDTTERMEAEAARAQLAAIVETSNDAIFSKTLDAVITSWNRGAERLYGYTAAEMVGQSVSLLLPPESKAELAWVMERARRGERIEPYDTRRVRKDGQLVEVSLSVSPICDQAGQIIGCSAIAHDITERERIAGALRKSERSQRERAAELAVLLEAVPVPILIAHDPECLHLTGNRAANALLRIPAGEEASLSASDEIKPRHFKVMKDGRELSNEELPAQQAARGIPVQNSEFSLVFDDGTMRHVLGYGTPLHDDEGRPRGAINVLVDITERIQAERMLKKALDKEVVLRREIHHRVKNNLQVIISLLYLQSTRISDPMTLEILRESQVRTRAIAITYELLSESEDLSRIDAAEYVRQLTSHLLTVYRDNSRTAALAIHAERIFVSLDTALPCGLIITELVSNALKYAFPDGREGTITIVLEPDGDGLMKLAVRDDGVGLPEGFDVTNLSTMGLKLVGDLTRQLDGKVEFRSEHGTVVAITFPNPEPREPN